MNQQLYDQLIAAGQVLMKQNEEIERCVKIRMNIKKIKLETEDILKKKKVEYNARFVVGAILAGLFFLPAFFFLGRIGSYESVKSMFSTFFFTGLPCLIGVALLASIPMSKFTLAKKVEAEYQATKEINDRNIVKLEVEIQKIQEDLKEYLRQNQHKLSFIPEDYQDIQAVSFMIRVVHNLRADSLKEALNLYDLELKHQQTLAVAEQQRAQNENLMAAIKMVNARQEQINDKQSKTNAMLTGMIVADIIEDLFD